MTTEKKEKGERMAKYNIPKMITILENVKYDDRGITEFTKEAVEAIIAALKEKHEENQQ